MAHTFSVPIRFQFIHTPVAWEIRTAHARKSPRKPELEYADFAFPVVMRPRAGKVRKLDGWKCREAFFALRNGDNKALLRFLKGVGLWDDVEISSHRYIEVNKHCQEGHPPPITVDGLWRFRDALKRALLDKEGFKTSYAPKAADVEAVFQSGIEFPLRFELTKVAAGVIETTDAYHMLLATVFSDVARGLRFKKCARKDCGDPFEAKPNYGKVFCSWYCGHLVAQRNKRQQGKKERERAKRLATKKRTR